MRNIMTTKQLSICAKMLRNSADTCHRLIVDKRKQLDAIRGVGFASLTEGDLRKADILEEDIVTYMDEETAYLALADMIDGEEHVVSFKNTTGY